jgi:hypothetical protein
MAVLVGSIGCISHEETVYRDVERAKVEFETEKAARVFYEALSKMPSDERGEKETEVSLPIVFHHRKREVTGQNVRFNHAVERCDTNRDGVITEKEAAIFAESR